MWITLAENAINRGYIGSYAGNPEDVDFGTYSSNATGKVHLTTGNIPRLTVSNTGNIGIGTASPNSSAALDINSTSKGLLAPRLTKLQRETIASPATGLLVFDLTYKMFFYFDGVSWVPLKPSSLEEIGQGPQVPADNTTGSQFGYSVSTDSLWSISGAPYQNTSVGAAYIYQYTGGEWTEFAKLVPDDLQQQNFGASVSINFPYAVVGAPAYNTLAGCVYVFFYNGSNWVQVNKFFRPSSAAIGDFFGYSVDIDGNNFVVGCPGADIAFTNDGCIFTYKFNGSAWVYSNAPATCGLVLNNYSNVGVAVAIAHNTIVAGAPGLLVGGGQSGAALTYKLIAGVWGCFGPLPSSLWGGVGVKRKGYGKSVDICYNPSSYFPLSIIVGAPDTDFEYTSAPVIPDIGCAEVFLGDENGVSSLSSNYGISSNVIKERDPSGAIKSDFKNAQGYKFGSSVSIYHYGNYVAYPGLNIQIAVGCPGKNNNTGSIEVFNFNNALDPVTGLATGYLFTPSFIRSYDYSAPSSLMGSSVNMFNLTTMIAGASGAGNNKGAVVFKF